MGVSPSGQGRRQMRKRPASSWTFPFLLGCCDGQIRFCANTDSDLRKQRGNLVTQARSTSNGGASSAYASGGDASPSDGGASPSDGGAIAGASDGPNAPLRA